MLEDFVCSFCGKLVSATNQTSRSKKCYFNSGYGTILNNGPTYADVFHIIMEYCPSCECVSFVAIGDENLKGIEIPLNPKSLAKQFPDYIPLAIREDYEEAYSILKLSPKASATLSRRCLQGMIRDFWGIAKDSLYLEINAIKDLVTPSQWKAIDSVRSIGNIGAHMKKDVNEIIEIDDKEAEQLLKLIELLVDKWYISRNDEEELLKSIVQIKNSKTQKEKKENMEENKEELLEK